jgi:uncharacterized protein YlzI (FlbEa/FlbD family)
MTELIAALAMIVLHTGDGREIGINPKQVTSMREARETNKHFTDKVRCMVNLTDGKFVAVLETCDVVRNKIEQPRDNK